jgi:putative transposase
MAGGEVGLAEAIVRYAAHYGRHGYCRNTALLRRGGWAVDYKRVERI